MQSMTKTMNVMERKKLVMKTPLHVTKTKQVLIKKVFA